MKLAGRVALITGGGTGLGKGMALLFAKEGAKVAVCGRRPQPLQETVSEIEATGGIGLAVPTDVTIEEQVKRLVETVVSKFGTIDVLVNSAGQTTAGTAFTTPTEDFDRIINVNLKGTFLVCKHVLPHMLKQGRGSIINIGSIWGAVGATDRVAYCASKGGVINLTRAMALDHAKQGIRVNCICPGWVPTPMSLSMVAQTPNPEETLRQRHSMHPMGRGGTIEEVAAAALYLASDESAWVTGTCLFLDGGYTAR